MIGLFDYLFVFLLCLLFSAGVQLPEGNPLLIIPIKGFFGLASVIVALITLNVYPFLGVVGLGGFGAGFAVFYKK